MTIIGDTPIREPSEDRLGRAALAASLARQILQADAAEGLVVGVLGPWGSGKTSFVNLVRHGLESGGTPVLAFNPWLFSGTEHLVQAFFSELSAHFRFRPGLDDIGDMLDEYGEYLFAAPFVGPWAARASLLRRGARSWRRSRATGPQIEATRDKVRRSLERQERPLIVILDDLDRLTAGEIRDVFRMVRLTASFPNIIYVLAFDRHQVEKALSQDGVTGREYLEKIVQIVRDLPEVSREVMFDELTAAIEESLAGIDELGPFDDHTWGNVLFHVIMPLMRNVRDVRRYCASIRGTVTDLAGEICLTDVLALEAIRIFLPDVLARLRSAMDVVTLSLEPRIETPASTDDARQQVEQIAGTDDGRRAVAEALFEHVFPEGGRHLRDLTFMAGEASVWYQQRRVANTEIFRLYLERVEGRTLKMQRRGDIALSVMHDADGLQRYLQSLEPASLRQVIAALETHEDQFRPEHVIPGVTVLLNAWPSIPQHRRGLFDLDNRLVVTRVILRLLRALSSPADVISAVDVILPKLPTLSAQLELITTVGHNESAGHKLVSVQDAERIERSFRDSVRGATVDVLAREHDLMSVMYRAKKEASPSEPELVVSSDPTMTRSMLEAAKHEVRTEPINGPVRYTTCLHWDALVELYDDETVLRERISELRAQRPEGLTDLLELAERYLDGWRPNWRDDD